MEKQFLQLINDNRSLLYKVSNFYCRDPEGRRDLFQEMVLQLWKSYPSFRHASSSHTWLYRVALNTAISNLRRESRKTDKIGLALADFDIPDIQPEFYQQDDINALYVAIGRLNEIEKAVILLYLDERSYDEIAEIMGISISNVGVRISRIKNKLSKLIKHNDEYRST